MFNLSKIIKVHLGRCQITFALWGFGSVGITNGGFIRLSQIGSSGFIVGWSDSCISSGLDPAVMGQHGLLLGGLLALCVAVEGGRHVAVRAHGGPEEGPRLSPGEVNRHTGTTGHGRQVPLTILISYEDSRVGLAVVDLIHDGGFQIFIGGVVAALYAVILAVVIRIERCIPLLLCGTLPQHPQQRLQDSFDPVSLGGLLAVVSVIVHRIVRWNDEFVGGVSRHVVEHKVRHDWER